jgi:hypothetical protein
MTYMSVNLIALKNASSLVSTNTQKAFKDDLQKAWQNHLKQALSAHCRNAKASKDKLKADYQTAQLETGPDLSFNEKAPSTNANMRSRD